MSVETSPSRITRRALFARVAEAALIPTAGMLSVVLTADEPYPEIIEDNKYLQPKLAAAVSFPYLTGIPVYTIATLFERRIPMLKVVKYPATYLASFAGGKFGNLFGTTLHTIGLHPNQET